MGKHPQYRKPGVTPAQMRTAIVQLQRRIDELQGFDPQSATRQPDPRIQALEALIDRTELDALNDESKAMSVLEKLIFKILAGTVFGFMYALYMVAALGLFLTLDGWLGFGLHKLVGWGEPSGYIAGSIVAGIFCGLIDLIGWRGLGLNHVEWR